MTRMDGDAPSRQSSAENDPVVAVVGVGNRLLRDDGVGPRVIDTLERSVAVAPAQLRLFDAGTTGFLALEAMSGCERATVVDAIRTGQPPGTVQEYRFKDGGFDEEVPQMTMHDVSFTEALSFARDVYDLPDDVRIIGVEPESLDTGLTLSPPVRKAIPAVIERISEYEPTVDLDELSTIDSDELSTITPDELRTVSSDELSALAPGDESGVSERFQDTMPAPTTHEVKNK